MKPTNRIIHGDVIDSMKKLPSESFDLVFIDPPFNLRKKYDNADDTLNDGEYLRWCYEWIDECVRVLSRTGTIFIHNIPKWLIYFANHLNEQKMIFRHWIAWDALGVPLGKTLLPSHYGILYYTKTKDFKFNDLRKPHGRCVLCGEVNKDYGGKKSLMHPYGNLLSDVWIDIHRIRHNKRRDVHPCQLPEQLMERLIMMATDVGDSVLDPMMGTGTTLCAAKRMGRKYTGIDNAITYVDIAKQKLKEVRRNRTNSYTYFYNKTGQTRTSVINCRYGKNMHTIPDNDIVVSDIGLDGEKPSLYFQYDVKAVPKKA